MLESIEYEPAPRSGLSAVSGKKVLWWSGAAALVTFVVSRGLSGYGNMFLPRADGSWQQWLHVSKYPPSLTYAAVARGSPCDRTKLRQAGADQ